MVEDFNVICSPLEKSLGDKVTRSMRSFNDFIVSCSLMDLPLVKEKFSWANISVRNKIDRFLLSKGMLSGVLERFWVLG